MNSLQVFGVRWPDDLEMYEVVGESFRVAEVRKVGDYIRKNARFIPHRACLVPMSNMPEHPNAVGVFFVHPGRNWLGMRKDVSTHVGFLASEEATKFRRDMKALGLASHCVECAGCVVDHESSQHPSVRVYVPLKFGSLAKKGYLDDQGNYPAWLRDESAVAPRPVTKSKGGDYSDDELRKLFCYRAQQKGWYSLPDRAELCLGELRHAGAGMLHFAVKEYASESVRS